LRSLNSKCKKNSKGGIAQVPPKYATNALCFTFVHFLSATGRVLVHGGECGSVELGCSQYEFSKQSKSVNSERWERWRAKGKLVSGSNHQGRFCWVRQYEIPYAKSCNLVHFWPENGSQWRP